MRHMILVLCVVAAVAIGAYLLYLCLVAEIEDYRWVIVATPVFLLIAREVSDRMPWTAARHPRPRPYELAVEPKEDEEPDEPPAWDREDVEEPAPQALAGLWAGTARVWPAAPDEVLRILPLRLAFHHKRTTTRVIPAGTAAGGPRIVAASVLEYDAANGELDLRLVVEQAGRRRSFDARLVLRSGRIVPEDETDPVTVELRPAQFVTVAC